MKINGFFKIFLYINIVIFPFNSLSFAASLYSDPGDKLGPASRFQLFLESQATEEYEQPFTGTFQAGLLIAKALRRLKSLSMTDRAAAAMRREIEAINDSLKTVNCRVLQRRFTSDKVSGTSLKFINISFNGLARQVVFADRDLSLLPASALTVLGLEEDDIDLLKCSDQFLSNVWILGKQYWGFLHTPAALARVPVVETEPLNEAEGDLLWKAIGDIFQLQADGKIPAEVWEEIEPLLNKVYYSSFPGIYNGDDDFMLAFWRRLQEKTDIEISLTKEFFLSPDLIRHLARAVFHESCEAAGYTHDQVDQFTEQVFGAEEKESFDRAVQQQQKLEYLLKCLTESNLLSLPDIERIRDLVYYYFTLRIREFSSLTGELEEMLTMEYEVEKDNLLADLFVLLEEYLDSPTEENKEEVKKEASRLFIVSQLPQQWKYGLGESSYNGLREVLLHYHWNNALGASSAALESELTSGISNTSLSVLEDLLIDPHDLWFSQRKDLIDRKRGIAKEIVERIFPAGVIVTQFGIPVAETMNGQSFVLAELMLKNRNLRGINTSTLIRITSFLLEKQVLARGGTLRHAEMKAFLDGLKSDYPYLQNKLETAKSEWVRLCSSDTNINGLGRSALGRRFGNLLGVSRSLFNLKSNFPPKLLLRVLRGEYYEYYHLVTTKLKGTPVEGATSMLAVAQLLRELGDRGALRGKRTFSLHDVREAYYFMKVIRLIFEGRLLYRLSDEKVFEIVRYDSNLGVTEIRPLAGSDNILIKDFANGWLESEGGVSYWVEEEDGVRKRYLVEGVSAEEGTVAVVPEGELETQGISSSQKRSDMIRNYREYFDEIKDIRFVLHFHLNPGTVYKFNDDEVDAMRTILTVINDYSANSLSLVDLQQRLSSQGQEVLRKIVALDDRKVKPQDRLNADDLNRLFNSASSPTDLTPILEKIKGYVPLVIMLHTEFNELLAAFDKFIFCSEQTRNMWMESISFPPGDSRVVDNEAWHELFRLEDARGKQLRAEDRQLTKQRFRDSLGIVKGKKVMCYSGRIARAKGYGVLRKFILEKLPQHKDWVLVIATTGQGDMAKDFVKLLKAGRLTVDEREIIRELLRDGQLKIVVDLRKYCFVIEELLDFAAAGSGKDVLTRFYRQDMRGRFGAGVGVYCLQDFPVQLVSDVLIYPTHAEAASLAIHEANEAGCKIAASRLGGNSVGSDNSVDILLPRIIYNRTSGQCLEEWEERYWDWVERMIVPLIAANDLDLTIAGSIVTLRRGTPIHEVIRMLKTYQGESFTLAGITYVLMANYMHCVKARNDITNTAAALQAETEAYYQAVNTLLTKTKRPGIKKNYEVPPKTKEIYRQA